MQIYNFFKLYKLILMKQESSQEMIFNQNDQKIDHFQRNSIERFNEFTQGQQLLEQLEKAYREQDNYSLKAENNSNQVQNCEQNILEQKQEIQIQNGKEKEARFKVYDVRQIQKVDIKEKKNDATQKNKYDTQKKWNYQMKGKEKVDRKVYKKVDKVKYNKKDNIRNKGQKKKDKFDYKESRKYTCKYCSKVFIKSQALGGHVARKHKQIQLQSYQLPQRRNRIKIIRDNNIINNRDEKSRLQEKDKINRLFVEAQEIQFNKQIEGS